MTNKRRRGFILLTSLMVLMGVATLAAAGFVNSIGELQVSKRFVAKEQAFELAEAGVNQAIWEFAKSNSDFLSAEGWAALSGTACSAGTCYQKTPPAAPATVNVIDATGSTPIIRSTGLVSSVPQTIEVVLELPGGTLFQQPVFGEVKVSIGGENSIDSYNSANGAYGGANRRAKGTVRTNSTESNTVTLGASTTVYGDVLVGAAGNPFNVINKDPSASICANLSCTTPGNQATAPADLALPPITIPSGLSQSGNLVVAANQQVVLPAGSYWYNNIQAASGSSIRTTGRVTIYVSGAITFQEGSTFGGQNDLPTNLIVQVLSEAPANPSQYNVALRKFYGAMYAPKARVTAEDTVYGAIVAKEFYYPAESSIHYDEALSSVPVSGPSRATIRSWRQP